VNEAITRNRLDHRVDAAALEGAWSQLLSGMNETMAAFADLHGRRREAELELERVFTMSVDLLCIAGFDGYLKRVNPAWMRTLGYTEQDLLSRPFIEFAHPEDRAHTEEALGVLAEGHDLVEFENRHLCRDGSARWLQWTSRPVLEQRLAYSVARDYIAEKIRCNAVSPGRVHTPFVDGYLQKNYPGREQEMFDRLSKAQPVGRMARPDEVASMALYLCSEEGSFLTGMDYLLDGGFTHLRG